ncbi:hypothetical protein [Aquibacillus sediminis]|uniref:hypothetical protein n=1 Tax=Aquibacillus sediminis TaxID=2574734 RepID=UPI001107A9B9|nr:hypothetical protein [Aquibacillus sediminis]
MKKRVTIVSFVVLIIVVIILAYQWYVANTLLNLQQERDFLSIESKFEELAYRSERLIAEWDNEASDAANILNNEFLKAEGLLWGRPATKYYKISLGNVSNSNFTNLAQFLIHYHSTISNDLEQIKLGERSIRLKERAEMISKDMVFLSENMKSKTLQSFSNHTEFYKHWSDLKDNLQNKEAAK